MKKLIYLSLTLLAASQACRKTIIITPRPCMTLNTQVMHVHDTLVVTNCSVADMTTICYIDSTQLPPNECKCAYTMEVIDKNGRNIHIFPKPGSYRACLVAQNHQTGAPVEYLTQGVKVLP